MNTIQEKLMRARLAQEGLPPLTSVADDSTLSDLMSVRHESKDADPNAFNLVGEVSKWRAANQQRLTNPHKIPDGTPANRILCVVRKVRKIEDSGNNKNKKIIYSKY